MGAEGSKEIEDIRVGGLGAVVGRAGGLGAVVGGAGGTDGGTDGAGSGGSSMCSAIGDRSPSGLSAAGSSSSSPGGGRRKARGMACHRSIVRVASQPQGSSNRSSTENPMCSSTWHKSHGNRRGMDSARGKLRRWTLSSK